jgi:hypothetical protein
VVTRFEEAEVCETPEVEQEYQESPNEETTSFVSPEPTKKKL